MSFRTNRRDVNQFETDTKGRLFVVGVSINWPSNRKRQTKMLDSWKVTQLSLFHQERVNNRRFRNATVSFQRTGTVGLSQHQTNIPT